MRPPNFGLLLFYSWPRTFAASAGDNAFSDLVLTFPLISLPSSTLMKASSLAMSTTATPSNSPTV
jgi:hypothetical protein